jgi:hypothetical protein
VTLEETSASSPPPPEISEVGPVFGPGPVGPLFGAENFSVSGPFFGAGKCFLSPHFGARRRPYAGLCDSLQR